MSFRPPPPAPGIILARLLLASVFVVMGGWRLWTGFTGPALEQATLAFSIAELVLGLLVIAGWRLRWTASAAALLMVADALIAHPFWTLGEPGRSAQLLHFMKNASIAGGFLLLAATGTPRRR